MCRVEVETKQKRIYLDRRRVSTTPKFAPLHKIIESSLKETMTTPFICCHSIVHIKNFRRGLREK